MLSRRSTATVFGFVFLIMTAGGIASVPLARAQSTTTTTTTTSSDGSTTVVEQTTTTAAPATAVVVSPHPLGPAGVGGVARRTSRRVSRRN